MDMTPVHATVFQLNARQYILLINWWDIICSVIDKTYLLDISYTVT